MGSNCLEKWDLTVFEVHTEATDLGKYRIRVIWVTSLTLSQPSYCGSPHIQKITIKSTYGLHGDTFCFVVRL